MEIIKSIIFILALFFSISGILKVISVYINKNSSETIYAFYITCILWGIFYYLNL